MSIFFTRFLYILILKTKSKTTTSLDWEKLFKMSLFWYFLVGLFWLFLLLKLHLDLFFLEYLWLKTKKKSLKLSWSIYPEKEKSKLISLEKLFKEYSSFNNSVTISITLFRSLFFSLALFFTTYFFCQTKTKQMFMQFLRVQTLLFTVSPLYLFMPISSFLGFDDFFGKFLTLEKFFANLSSQLETAVWITGVCPWL